MKSNDPFTVLVTVAQGQQGYFTTKQAIEAEGKSGLNIQGRESLGQMIEDVQNGKINFGSILVYDVSRWGRFQDADESAYYEYLCRRAGISVHYCAEQFENDGSPVKARRSNSTPWC